MKKKTRQQRELLQKLMERVQGNEESGLESCTTCEMKKEVRVTKLTEETLKCIHNYIRVVDGSIRGTTIPIVIQARTSTYQSSSKSICKADT